MALKNVLQDQQFCLIPFNFAIMNSVKNKMFFNKNDVLFGSYYIRLSFFVFDSAIIFAKI